MSRERELQANIRELCNEISILTDEIRALTNAITWLHDQVAFKNHQSRINQANVESPFIELISVE